MAERAAARSRPPTVTQQASVTVVWRAVVLISAVTLFININTAWRPEAPFDRRATVAFILGFAGILACAVLAVTVRRAAAMRRVEFGVLGLAVLLYGAELPHLFPVTGRRYAGDEGTLTELAGRALRHGTDPYTLSWPQAFYGRESGITTTLSGHVVSRYEYPPMTAILNAVAGPFTRNLPVAAFVAISLLVVTAIVMFFLLPSPWRTAAPMICLGLGLYAGPARRGATTIDALPLLMLAVYRWTSIGSSGRLGRAGWLSAACLGLAAATQQLTWFLAPFLIIGIYLVRRADRSARDSAILMGRYTAIAVAAFAIVNIPFAVWNFGAWLRGVTAPLTEGAVPFGQGIVAISYYLRGGSGALSFFNYAALLFAAALLISFVLFFRYLGPALAILPWTIFFFSTRAQETYYFLFIVLFAITLLTTDRAAIERAHQPGGRLRQRLRLDSTARLLTVAAVFAPAAACVLIAIGTTQPLRLSVAPPAAGPDEPINALVVTATNTSGHAIRPHFALSSSSNMSRAWRVATGPRTLQPGATATYVINPPFPRATRVASARTVLRVFSADPGTLSSALVTAGTRG
jgi:hypothetical protein